MCIVLAYNNIAMLIKTPPHAPDNTNNRLTSITYGASCLCVRAEYFLAAMIITAAFAARLPILILATPSLPVPLIQGRMH